MGKKGDKSTKEKPHTQPSEDSIGKTPEPYKCIGNFAIDFTELYKELYPNQFIIPISPVGKRGLTPYPNETSAPTQTTKKAGKDDKKGQALAAQSESEQILPEDKEIVEKFGFKPKYFPIKPNYAALKPMIYVETDNIDKIDNIFEIIIKRWKIDNSIMEIFENCFQMYSKLSTLSLWRVGLDSGMISRLAELLNNTESIKTLRLEDNNEAEEENYYEFIGMSSNLTKFYLRHCNLTPFGTKLIAEALGSLSNSNGNTKLLILDLSNNKLGDHGAAYLANSLKINRTLLSLNLSNCDIGDDGCTELAKSVSHYLLSKDEIMARRHLLSETHETTKTMTPPPSRRGDSKDRPTSVRSSIKDEKVKKDKNTPKGKKDTKDDKHEKGGAKGKKEEKGAKKTTALIEPKQGASKTKGRSARGNKTGTASEPASDGEHNSSKTEYAGFDNMENIHPLLTKVENEGPGKLRINGNFVLIVLNLSRNRISEEGLKELSVAVSHQSQQNKIGLMKLLLLGNRFCSTDEEYQKINTILLERDRKSKTPGLDAE